MRRNILILVISLSCLGWLYAVPPSPMWDVLTPCQQSLLTSGEQVILEEQIPGNAWPRYTVYQLVNSSAAQAISVFWDCELDPQYVPNCLSVKVVARPSPWICEGEYTLKMPLMLPNEVYVSRNVLTAHEAGSYEISWNVQKARYITASKGNIRVESLNIPKTSGTKSLIRYSNLVIPGSSVAGLLQSEARCEVSQSVKSLVTQIEKEIATSPQLLNQQLQHMQQGLKGASPTK